MKRRRNNSKPKFQNSDQSTPTTPEDFSFSLTKIAVSQICRSVGYKSIDSSVALNTLTLITTKFLQSLAGLAASFSNTANRTEVNLLDIVNALQNLSLSTSDYFPGGSTVRNTCLIKSAVLRNLFDFVTNAPEIPFAKPLPKREIDRSLNRDLPLNHRSSEMMMNYVPAWLPPFPETSLCIENCTKERSDHLWENSDSVVLPDSSRSESYNSGGILPVRRAIVRFKVERDLSSGGGGDNRLERWRDNNDGESGREFERKKKICEELIYSAGIVANHQKILNREGIRTRDA